MISHCLICDNTQFQTHQIKEMMFGTYDVFNYIECVACGTLQIQQIPENIQKYYPTEYHSFEVLKDLKRGKNAKLIKNLKYRLLFHKSLFFNILSRFYKIETKYKEIAKLIKNKNSNILDIGCGSGELLFKLKESGCENVKGIDPFIDHDIKYDNGLEIKKMLLEDEHSKFDFIMSNHSLEHVPLPVNFMKKVSEIMLPDAKLMIRVPSLSSKVWEMYRENWYQIDAPRHLFIPTHKAMKILGEKSGLKLDKIVCDSTAAQFMLSNKYVKGLKLNEKEKLSFLGKIKRKIAKYSYQRLSKQLNTKLEGDQAIYIYSKMME